MNFLRNTLKTPPKDLGHGFQAIYCFSRCVGLWPFKITYNSNGSIKEARVDLFDKLWLLISICLHSVATFFTYGDATNAYIIGHFNFAQMIFSMSQIPDYLLGVVCIILDMFNRNRLVNVLKNIIIFDREVSLKIMQDQMNINYKPNNNFTLFFLDFFSTKIIDIKFWKYF